jgi:uncharacterized protein with HEPN domain
MKGPLSDKVRIQHILDAITEVGTYIADVTEDQFLQNSEKRFATIKQIEIIGEACNKITEELKRAHSEIPWRQVIGFRNISIHEYHNVSFLIVWGIAANELPALKERFSKILSEL